jgi:hypothetical protein
MMHDSEILKLLGRKKVTILVFVVYRRNRDSFRDLLLLQLQSGLALN